MHVVAAVEHRRLAHLDRAHVHFLGERLLVVGRGLAVAQDVEHHALRRRHVGLVERADLHEVAAHGDGVLPHHEVLGELFHRLDLVVLTRNRRIDVGEAHLEVMALVPQVVLRLVHDDAAVARVLGEQKRVDLDVRQDALAELAEALGHELLDPQAEHAAALLREERELVAAHEVIVVEERRQPDRRVVDGVFAALLFSLDRVLEERVEVDACERRRQKTEHRKRREAAAHGRLA